MKENLPLNESVNTNDPLDKKKILYKTQDLFSKFIKLKILKIKNQLQMYQDAPILSKDLVQKKQT
jgi:hypothetical protein